MHPEFIIDVTESILIPYKFPLNSPNSMNLEHLKSPSKLYFQRNVMTEENQRKMESLYSAEAYEIQR